MLAQIAEKIFKETLVSIDAKQAILRAVNFDGSKIFINNAEFVDVLEKRLYVVAVGKAAYQMAEGLDETAGKFIKGGVVSSVVKENKLDQKWQVFGGGHPVPNEESINAAKAAFDLLAKADAEKAAVIFLVSGGGSAMMELPKDEKITLDELQIFNQALVTSGATIAEINSVRRAVSKVKGGGLALAAPNAKKITLIISDTADGDISSVASGPSLLPDQNVPDVFYVLQRYSLQGKIPASINSCLLENADSVAEPFAEQIVHVLLDNQKMVSQAGNIATDLGFEVFIDEETDELEITEGCDRLFAKFVEHCKKRVSQKPLCMISGGEFGCKVIGSGIGGRNSELVLRLLLKTNEIGHDLKEFAVLSAGSDGIDGNSPAAGAVGDQTSLHRAESLKLDARSFLDNSDSFTFFDALKDAVMTGSTGTNVRDLRIFLAK